MLTKIYKIWEKFYVFLNNVWDCCCVLYFDNSNKMLEINKVIAQKYGLKSL